MNLYYNNRSRTSAGLALVKKLKYEHVYLTSYSKMRVDLAVQVSICNLLFTTITNIA